MRDIFFFYRVDNILLTSVFFQFESSSPVLLVHVTARGWLVNTDKVQGPGLSTKFKDTPDLPPLNNYRHRL